VTAKRSRARWLAFLAVAGLAGLATTGAWAQGAKPANKPEDKAAEGDKKSLEVADQVIERHGSVKIAGAEVKYTTRSGTLVVRDEDGKAKAKMFFVAYTKDGADAAKRPVTFTFNGGPGSSSVWLHLGAFGPKRVWLGEDGTAAGPPYRMVENEGSILDVTDLVFIDPVTTGYSRSIPVDEDQPFHGVSEDIQSVGDFIRLWTSRYERWASPKFLAGESYGTTRAAGLSGYLQRRHGMFLNGIVLISAVLDFATGDFHPGHDLPYPLFLPTYTATAWYHRRLPADLQADLGKALREVEEFARTDYPRALWLGDRLPEADRKAVAAKLARVTGFSEADLLRWNLRIPDDKLYEELLKAQGYRVGRLDSRFKAVAIDGAPAEGIGADPSYDNILGPYSAALNAYVRGELGFESDLPYEILTGRVRPWSYKGFENQFVNVGVTLAAAMRQNPALKVYVGNGYYDVATPYFATAYTFDHIGLTPEMKQNVRMGYYEAGHMMYIHRPSLVKLRQELVDFYRWSVN
jgi:carboxypeptidase C (cathepsin A)